MSSRNFTFTGKRRAASVASEPLFIDNSTMKAMARCSTEALVRYGLDYAAREERAPLRAGSAAHRAMETYYKGEPNFDFDGTPYLFNNPIQAALAIFELEYAEWAEENVSPDDRLSYANTSKILAYWFDRHPIKSLPFKIMPELVEVGFCLPLADEVYFVGRMDSIVEDLSASMPAWYVEDHKFTGRINPTFVKALRLDSQLSGYIYAAQQHTNKSVVGAYINAVEFSKLPSDPTRKCSKHGVLYSECGEIHTNYELIGPITRSESQIEAWKDTAIKLAREYRKLVRSYPTLEHVELVPQEGMFHQACAFCGFYDFCSVGRPLNLVDSLLVLEPWRPYSYSQAKAPTTGHKP